MEYSVVRYMIQKNPKEEYFWFVGRTIAQGELNMRTYFNNHQIDCFVPTKKEIRKRKGEMVETEIPIVHNLVFFKADYTLANTVFNLNYRKIHRIRFENQLLHVSESQMAPFIRFVNENFGKVKILETSHVAGDKVMVKKGPFAGMIGKVIKIDDKDYFSISLNGLLVAAVKFPKANLIKVEEAEKEISPGKCLL